MKKVSIFLAVMALMMALSPSTSEARHCKSAMSHAWRACRIDTSSPECCSAMGDVAEQCPAYFRWGWLPNTRCEADNDTPVTAEPPKPAAPTPIGSPPTPIGSPPTPIGSPPTPIGSPPTPIGSPSGSTPRMTCEIGDVLADCMTEMSGFTMHGTAISDRCCQSIIHLQDVCQTSYNFIGYDFWNRCHAFCVGQH